MSVPFVVVSVMGTPPMPSLMRPTSVSVFPWPIVLLIASSPSIGPIHIVTTLSVLLILSKLLVLSKWLLVQSVLSKTILSIGTSSVLLILIKPSLSILSILSKHPLLKATLPSILLTISIILLFWLAVIAILCKLNIVLTIVLAILFIVTLSLYCLLSQQLIT